MKSNLDNISNVDFRPMADPVPVKPVWPIKLIFISILLVISIYFIFIFGKIEKKEILKKILSLFRNLQKNVQLIECKF